MGLGSRRAERKWASGCFQPWGTSSDHQGLRWIGIMGPQGGGCKSARLYRARALAPAKLGGAHS